MSYETFKRMIYFFVCGITDEVPKAYANEDTDLIRKAAEKNNVLPSVVYAFLKAKQKDESCLVNEDDKHLKREIFAYASRETKRHNEIHKLLCEFERNGKDVCVLKGDSLAELYCKNAVRASGDTDLYAGENISEKQINEILTQAGFFVLKRPPESHHVRAKGKNSGLVEVHLTLHDEQLESIWFKHKSGVKSEYVTKKTADGFEFKALAPTDEFLFVTMHFIKHFLISGVGIKQLADVCFYVAKKKNEIDFTVTDAIFKDLKYDKFFDTALSLAADVMNIDKENLHFVNGYCSDAALKDEILYDCYTGGVFGSNDKDRNKFYEEYTKLRFEAENNNSDYEKYVKHTRKKYMLKRMILSNEELKKRYTYVKKSPVLIPIGHINHASEIIWKIFTGKRKTTEYKIQMPKMPTKAVNKRMNLIKKLDMI